MFPGASSEGDFTLFVCIRMYFSEETESSILLCWLTLTPWMEWDEGYSCVYMFCVRVLFQRGDRECQLPYCCADLDRMGRRVPLCLCWCVCVVSVRRQRVPYCCADWRWRLGVGRRVPASEGGGIHRKSVPLIRVLNCVRFGKKTLNRFQSLIKSWLTFFYANFIVTDW